MQEEIEIQCPICGNPHAKLFQKNLNIPYYKDFFMTSIICNKCGLKSTDFRNVSSSEPVEFRYKVDSLSDFTTKIVRSSTGVVEIPEIGIKVEPQMMPETWIKNVEGLLLHFEEKVTIFLSEEDPEIVEAAKERINLIKKCLEGEISFTIIVSDKEGNSLIIPAHEEKLVKIIKK